MLKAILAIFLIGVIVVAIGAMIVIRTVYKGFSWFRKAVAGDFEGNARYSDFSDYTENSERAGAASGSSEHTRSSQSYGATGRAEYSGQSSQSSRPAEATIVAAPAPREKIIPRDEGEYTDFTEE